ncbi:MAG: MBL fold metallo-hydrolase [Lentimicrobiaceae bacterium]|nr:MBL fold metallo-hydrolase [Lentimicrobiaceae bacterium]
MHIYSIIGDVWGMDGGVAYGVIPKTIWNKLTVANERNFIRMITRCMLVVYDDKKILIEVGMGNKQRSRYYEVRERNDDYNVVKSLGEVGYKPEDITDVIFTHLHDDHVGAATYYDNEEIKHTYPNANYWVSKDQWDWALARNKREYAAFLPENLTPLLQSGRLNLVEKGQQPFKNIELRLFYGHTIGLIVPIIHYKDKFIVYGSDFLPSAYHLPFPYIAAADIQPLVTLEEKEKFLPEAFNNNYFMFYCHDTDNEVSTIQQNEKGYVMGGSYKLEEIL